ncbi:MAG: hypothetical protein ACRC33_12820, partial [Gemmataceae bacterium]
YIEVPSREWESCRDLERPGQVGLSHHRWLIEEKGGGLLFYQKYHLMHTHWRFSLPASHVRSMPPERKVTCLWWDRPFAASEVTIHGLDRIEAEFERFVRETKPHPGWRLAVDRWGRAASRLASRVAGGVRRGVSGCRPG